MNNYDELEKLYYKKKFKKYFFYILIFLIFIVVGFFTYFNFKKNEQTHKLISVEKTPKKYIHKEINKTKNIESIKKIESNKTKNYKNLKDKSKKNIDKLSLNPILPAISSDSILEENNTIKNITKPTTTTDDLEIKKEVKKEVKEINTTNEIQEPIKPKIIIKVTKEKESLKNLIDNYQLSPDYSTAIKITKIYFKHKNYKKSIEWAKKANEINPEDSKSWLLYAKSLVKLGKRNRARLLLENYLKVYGNNQEITNYLRSLNERKHTKKN